MEFTVSESFIISLCEKLVIKSSSSTTKERFVQLELQLTALEPLHHFLCSRFATRPVLRGKAPLVTGGIISMVSKTYTILFHLMWTFQSMLLLHWTLSQQEKSPYLPVFSPLLPKTDKICRCFVALFRSVSLYMSSSQCC